jgi:hypothetical protein
MRRFFSILCGLICAGGLSLFASGLDATATYTDTQISPGEFQYNLTLNNIGSTPIGTFWFGWIPGADFMPVDPTAITSPTGWGDQVTTDGPPDGFAILWTANSAAHELAAGGTLTGFGFESSLTPVQLESLSVENPGDPVSTAFVYIGPPFADPGLQFLVTPAVSGVPEPASIAITALGFGLMALCSTRIRRRKNALGQ